MPKPVAIAVIVTNKVKKIRLSFNIEIPDYPVKISVVSKIFTIAARHEKVDANPCQDVERFALDNERVRYLTEDEEQRLFKAMEDNAQLKDIVTVALHTGMRRGEIFNLKWFDLEFSCYTQRILSRSVCHSATPACCPLLQF